MWNMSSDMRKAIQPRVEHIAVPISDFNSLAKQVNIKKQYRVNAEGVKERIKEYTKKTIAVKNWDDTWIICTDDINAVKNELERIKRNRNKLEIYGNKEMSELQY